MDSLMNKIYESQKSDLMNLVVVAHPDDEVLGFGCAGSKAVKNGEIVQPIILCGTVDARHLRPSDTELMSDCIAANDLLGFKKPILGSFPNIKLNNVDHLTLVQFIEEQIVKFEPARIFTHHPADLNDDHKQIANACLTASRLYQRKKDLPPLQSLHFMEILSATDWSYETNVDGFRPNLYVEADEYLNLKLKALSCYRNVMRDYPHPRSEETIKGLAAYRGSQSGQMYSEAFQTVFQREL
jgi:LmbE family N-acetylglucosaminyl deacetylase